MTSYMVEIKGNGGSNLDVWNRSQTYYGKKLSFLYSNCGVIQMMCSISNSLARK
jgi:hypothetical protein